MLHVLHTADWHLGQTFHGVSRESEHRFFLSWLIDTLQFEGIDSLIIAGDVFDSANPTAATQALFYEFLADTRRRLPQLDVLVVAGNHDSPARMEAPQPLYEAIGIRVVGALPRLGKQLDTRGLATPLYDRKGELAAWCAAVPFLRPSDLPTLADGALDPLIEGVRKVYREAFEGMRSIRKKNQALLATGHCYMADTQLSESSERKILGGNLHALPADIFPADAAYVALGHLHFPQAVGGREEVRYCGSPLPLSLDEGGYVHQVVKVSLDGVRASSIEAIRIPRTIPILRLPEEGPLPLNDVLERLQRLELSPEASPLGPHFLEVRVLLETPEPGLRPRIEEALQEKPVRLLKVRAHYPEKGDSLADYVPEIELKSLDPYQVFRRRYRQDGDQEPPEELAAAFHELVESVQGEERP